MAYIRLIVFVVAAALVTVLALALPFNSGSCPPKSKVYNNKPVCHSDADCQKYGKICCPNQFNTKTCTDRVPFQLGNDKNKYNNCPEISNVTNNGDGESYEKLKMSPQKFKEVLNKSLEILSDTSDEFSKNPNDFFGTLNKSPEKIKEFNKLLKKVLKKGMESPAEDSHEKVKESQEKSNKSPEEMLNDSIKKTKEFDKTSKPPLSTQKSNEYAEKSKELPETLNKKLKLHFEGLQESLKKSRVGSNSINIIHNKIDTGSVKPDESQESAKDQRTLQVLSLGPYSPSRSPSKASSKTLEDINLQSVSPPKSPSVEAGGSSRSHSPPKTPSGGRLRDPFVESTWKKYTTALGSPEKSKDFLKNSKIPLKQSVKPGGIAGDPPSRPNSPPRSPSGGRLRDPSIESTWKKYTTALGSPERSNEFLKNSKIPLKQSVKPGGIVGVPPSRPNSPPRSPSGGRLRDPSIESTWKKYTTALGSPERSNEFLRNSKIPLKQSVKPGGIVGDPSSRPKSPPRSPSAGTVRGRSDVPTWKKFTTALGTPKSSKESAKNSKIPIKESKESTKISKEINIESKDILIKTELLAKKAELSIKQFTDNSIEPSLGKSQKPAVDKSLELLPPRRPLTHHSVGSQETPRGPDLGSPPKPKNPSVKPQGPPRNANIGPKPKVPSVGQPSGTYGLPPKSMSPSVRPQRPSAFNARPPPRNPHFTPGNVKIPKPYPFEPPSYPKMPSFDMPKINMDISSFLKSYRPTIPRPNIVSPFRGFGRFG